MTRYSVQPRDDDLTGNKIAPQKLHPRIIQKKIVNMIEKYIEKDVYRRNRDRKLLMI